MLAPRPGKPAPHPGGTWERQRWREEGVGRKRRRRRCDVQGKETAATRSARGWGVGGNQAGDGDWGRERGDRARRADRRPQEGDREGVPGSSAARTRPPGRDTELTREEQVPRPRLAPAAHLPRAATRSRAGAHSGPRRPGRWSRAPRPRDTEGAGSASTRPVLRPRPGAAGGRGLEGRGLWGGRVL